MGISRRGGAFAGAAVLCLAALGLPGVAAAVDPPDCARMIRQLQHLDGMADRAAQLDNELWEARMRDQVALLEERLDNRCPEYTAEKKAIRKAIQDFGKFLAAAGKVALKVFTLGAM